MNEISIKRKRADFAIKQSLPYSVKVLYAKQRIREFEAECGARELNTVVTIGGLDSITLLCLIRSMHLSVPAISVSYVEDLSIQKVHTELGVIKIKPEKSYKQIITEYGYPIISKSTAQMIESLNNPKTIKATKDRYILGIGSDGSIVKNGRRNIPQKWLRLFGGCINEEYGTDYKIAPFKVSDKCCDYLKERPLEKWCKENNSVPYLGLQASEGGRRERALIEHGCNYFGKTTIRSAPFAIFLHEDILHLAHDLEVPVPEIYGEILCDEDGHWYTTGANRTSCAACGFGIHLEERPHRFDRMLVKNQKQWEYYMYTLGWARVLDYIGVPYDTPGNITSNAGGK